MSAQAQGEGGSYVMPAVSESEGEVRRLDGLHRALTRYFGGKLSLAPIADVRPRKILELGSGSGAWAIHAATEFPEAEVIAVDLSPLPNRKLPANITFKLADVSKDLDFEKETFDIVHGRFVMFHVAYAEAAIKRVAALVKPGGILILEETDLTSMVRTGGPAVRLQTEKIIPVFEARHSDTEIGRKLAGIMKSTGYFPDVHVRKAAAPLSGNGIDEALNELGLEFRRSTLQGTDAIKGRALPNTPDEEMIKVFKEELESKDCEVEMDLYFCWARRVKE
ncbi:S-adenosyl-L-methionine-dependent methyltransferase [Mycena polygramma]|nr:S-adenosyl-L-methionine-dependent methyltransferase [Mycena polygramma]